MDPSNFSWEIISRLFGEPFTSPAVGEFLSENGVDSVKLWQEVPIGLVTAEKQLISDTAEIDLKEIVGVRLRFRMGYLLRQFRRLGSEFLFSEVDYFAPGEAATAKAFTGSLPFSLSFADTEIDVLQKISVARSSQGEDAHNVYYFRRWDFPDYVLQTVFLTRSRQLRRVIGFLPLK
jgi:hypothetical protein